MQTSTSQTQSPATRRTRRLLAIVAVAALIFSAMRWAARIESARAAAQEAANRNEVEKVLAGADRREGAAKGINAASATGDAEYLPRPSTFEKELLAALEKPVDVEFLDTALEDCLNFLQEAVNIPFWMDKQTLTDEGVALDQPITLKLHGRRLESVLHLILKPVQLTFLPENDVLVITTATKAGENLITRTYPVRDLYKGREEQYLRRIQLSNAGGNAQQKVVEAAPNGGGDAAKPAQGAGDAAKEGDKKPDPKPAPSGHGGFAPRMPRFEDLEEALTSTIEPDSWEELSGPGAFTYVKETGCLVVRQTWAVHRQIVQLLRDLREAKYIGPDGKPAAPAGDARK